MNKSPTLLRQEFDEIARTIATLGNADGLSPAERALLTYLPEKCGTVLEVGCGHGALTRQVARRARFVLALDLSPEMIRVALARSARQSNIEYRVADITTTELTPATFDVVLSVAMLHHVPLDTTVARLAAAVRPGGWLLLQDLVARPGLRLLPVNALAWFVRQLRGADTREPAARALAAQYRAHGLDERYLTPPEADRAYAELLPGARVVHHLEWRYTIVWQRPATT